MKKTVAVIAAHPDDEALGAGGTLARHAAQGDVVHAVFFTDGVGARGQKDNASERNEAARKAAVILGIKAGNIHFLSFPDNKMDSVPLLDIVQALEKTLEPVRPQIIYTHHAGDLNQDHRVVAQAVLTACRPQPGSAAEEIYGFEVLSSTGWAGPTDTGSAKPGETFAPAHYVDITAHIDAKMSALRCYDHEMRPFPHARSYEAVEALATLRGAQMGIQRAEAFTVIRQIRK